MLTILFCWRLKPTIDIVLSINIYLFIYIHITSHILAQVGPQQVETIFTHPYWVQSKSTHNPTLPLTSYPPHPNYYGSQHYWLLCISGQLVGTFHLNCPVVILRRAPQKKYFQRGWWFYR
jgi:hypothetical protein